MTLDQALRWTEILLALAFIQQSIEHLYLNKEDRFLFLFKLVFSLVLLVNFQSSWFCLALWVNEVRVLRRFDGPYNGGADRMGMLILSCLSLIHFVPNHFHIYIFGYLALQLILSYFVAGWFKVINPEWWTGQALEDIFRFSSFPASESLRGLAANPRPMLALVSWVAILFELLFPLALLNQTTLVIALFMAFCFHLVNVYLFGFNRFVWVWIAAYIAKIYLS